MVSAFGALVMALAFAALVVGERDVPVTVAVGVNGEANPTSNPSDGVDVFDDESLPPALRASIRARMATAEGAPTAPEVASAADLASEWTPADPTVQPSLSEAAQKARARWPLPPGVDRITGYIQRVNFRSDEPFTAAATIAAFDQPVIIRNTSLTHWPAAAWTPEYMARQLEGLRLKNVKQSSTAPPATAGGPNEKNDPYAHRTFFYYHSSPMTAAAAAAAAAPTTSIGASPQALLAEHLALYKTQSYRYVNMSAHTYFAQILERSDIAQDVPPSSQSLAASADAIIAAVVDEKAAAAGAAAIKSLGMDP